MESFASFLDNKINTFNRTLNSICREGFEYDRPSVARTSCFSIFKMNTEIYYDGKFQEEIMEYLVRKYLVNDVLTYLFSKNHYDIRWSMHSTTLYSVSIYSV